MQYLKEFLESKVEKYNQLEFIELDPISIPHKYTLKEDIEIAGFFSATIAWGNRKAIIKSASKLMQWMDNSPYDFILNHTETDLAALSAFTYRTFNGIDCIFFIKSLQNIYMNHGGLESVFYEGYSNNNAISETLSHFRNIFFSIAHEPRTLKHIANPFKGSTAKRLNMYLRWMVRKDKKEVDFGIWNKIKMAHLQMPLDIHSGTVARKLNLLLRKQNDWKAVEELTNNLREFDINDPVKYDFALFGLGVNNDI